MLTFPPAWKGLRLVLNAAAVVWLLSLALALRPDVQSDAHTYWYSAQPGVDPYGRLWSLERDAYVYPPVFLQLLTPVARGLDWPAFHALWTLLLLGGVVWIAGPMLALFLLLPIRGWPVWEALIWGNIDVPLSLALIAAQRRPIAWSALAFTKVTPGVAMIWHVVRREWTALAVVGAASAGLFVLSYAIGPGLWSDWVGQIVRSDYRQPFSAPLSVRLVLAAILVACGAMSGRRWTIPIAVVVAHPAIWYNTLAIPVLWWAASARGPSSETNQVADKAYSASRATSRSASSIE